MNLGGDFLGTAEKLQEAQLRDANEDDRPAILAILNDSLISSTSTFESQMQTLESRREWFEHHGKNYPLIVAELGGKVVGYCSISSFERNNGYAKTVELSVYVDKNYRRRGIARILMNEMIRRARNLGFHVIMSSISTDNTASIQLHENFGFEFVGTLKEVGWKFSKWQDTNYYELIL